MSSPRLARPSLVVLAVAVVAVEALAAALTIDPLRALVRATARTSLVYFLPTFVASALVALRPGPVSKWLLRNRRSLGLAVAVSHAAHLVGIAALAVRDGAAFWATVATSSVVGGTAGYVLLAAMTATSTDGAVRRLGRRAWRGLHRAGMASLWLIFAASYAGRATTSPFAAVAVAALVAALAVRIAARVRHAGRAARRA